MMFTGIPNMVWVFGYFRASWTLRADLIADFVCRLLGHMEDLGATRVVPRLLPEEESMPRLDWMDPENFNPGYLMRSMHLLPKRLDRPEWQHTQDYWTEKDLFPTIDLDDGAWPSTERHVASRRRDGRSSSGRGRARVAWRRPTAEGRSTEGGQAAHGEHQLHPVDRDAAVADPAVVLDGRQSGGHVLGSGDGGEGDVVGGGGPGRHRRSADQFGGGAVHGAGALEDGSVLRGDALGALAVLPSVAEEFSGRNTTAAATAMHSRLTTYGARRVISGISAPLSRDSNPPIRPG